MVFQHPAKVWPFTGLVGSNPTSSASLLTLEGSDSGLFH